MNPQETRLYHILKKEIEYKTVNINTITPIITRGMTILQKTVKGKSQGNTKKKVLLDVLQYIVENDVKYTNNEDQYLLTIFLEHSAPSIIDSIIDTAQKRIDLSKPTIIQRLKKCLLCIREEADELFDDLVEEAKDIVGDIVVEVVDDIVEDIAGEEAAQHIADITRDVVDQVIDKVAEKAEEKIDENINKLVEHVSQNVDIIKKLVDDVEKTGDKSDDVTGDKADDVEFENITLTNVITEETNRRSTDNIKMVDIRSEINV